MQIGSVNYSFSLFKFIYTHTHVKYDNLVKMFDEGKNNADLKLKIMPCFSGFSYNLEITYRYKMVNAQNVTRIINSMHLPDKNTI